MAQAGGILTFASSIRETDKRQPKGAQQVVRLQLELKAALVRPNEGPTLQVRTGAAGVDRAARDSASQVIGFSGSLPLFRMRPWFSSHWSQ